MEGTQSIPAVLRIIQFKQNFLGPLTGRNGIVIICPLIGKFRPKTPSGPLTRGVQNAPRAEAWGVKCRAWLSLLLRPGRRAGTLVLHPVAAIRKGTVMHVLPRTTIGKWSLGMLIVVLLYPLYWSVFLAIPDTLRPVRIAVGLVIIALALGSVVLAGVAVFRQQDRSLVLYVLGGLALLGVLLFAIGEVAVPH